MLDRLGSTLRIALTAGLVSACLALGATSAQANTDIAGKKVIFVPISMGISLT